MTECTYKDIEFGKSSGEQEGLEYPELVENGFFDFWHCGDLNGLGMA